MLGPEMANIWSSIVCDDRVFNVWCPPQTCLSLQPVRNDGNGTEVEVQDDLTNDCSRRSEKTSERKTEFLSF